jgi:hypothetical protein
MSSDVRRDAAATSAAVIFIVRAPTSVDSIACATASRKAWSSNGLTRMSKAPTR